MSKYKITVENTETGEQKKYDADFYSIVANDFDAIGVVSAMEGKGDALQILQVLMAMDNAKKRMLKDRSDVRLAYTIRNMLLGPSTEIDLTEMRRQAGQMEEG